MWLYEVKDDVRLGVRVLLTPGHVGIPLGTDQHYRTPITLLFGRSLSRELDHPDDHHEEFILKRGSLQESNSGYKLIKQTEQEATEEGKALVFIDRCTDDELGHTRVTVAWRRSSPKLLMAEDNPGLRREVYEFNKGDGLFICWPPAALDQRHPKRFIIEWDGTTLTEVVCQRRPRSRQRRERRPHLEEQASLRSQQLRA